jgi:hypothetical protein
MRLRVERLIAGSPADFRAASRAIVRLGARCGLLAHRVVDTHVHVLVACSREAAGRFVCSVESCLTQTLALRSGFEPARFTPVEELRHLHRAFVYILRQAERHGAALDRTHDGSLLPDLLGMRCIDPGAAERVTRAMPRVRAEELAGLLGMNDVAGGPILAAHLAGAAAAALALPDIAGRDPPRVLARRAAAFAGAELRPAEIADALGVTRRALFYLRACAPVPDVRAVILQAKLRARLESAAASAFWDPDQ